jgi:hypothetical protein
MTENQKLIAVWAVASVFTITGILAIFFGVRGLLLAHASESWLKITISKFFKIGFISSLLVLAGCSEEKAGRPPETGTKQIEAETADLEETDSEETDPSKTVLGPLDVYYTVQTGPSSTAGTGRIPMKASAIHFFDTYIVVEAPESGGRVFPSNKIIDFDWRGGGRIEPAKEAEGERQAPE